MAEALRPYIQAGDWVVAVTHGNVPARREEGYVEIDVEGELRVARRADADPYGPDGLPVNARWVNIESWIKAAPRP